MTYSTGIADDLELSAEEERDLNSAALIIGGAAVGSGGGIAAEILRRKAARGDGNLGAAAKELRDDAGAALNVLTGRSPYDRELNDYDENKKAGLVPTRSLRSYATQSDLQNPMRPSMYNASSTQGYIANPLTQMAISARDAFNPSSEDFLSSKRSFRQQQGMSAEGPRTDTVFARIPGLDGIRDLAGDSPIGYSKAEQEFRQNNNLALMKDNLPQRVGGFLGRSGADFVNNGARSLWWLLNAPQAVVDISSEATMGMANREGLYGQDLVTYDEALSRDWISADGEPRDTSISRASSEKEADPYYKKRYKELQDSIKMRPDDPYVRQNIYGRRRTGNNLSTLLALPAAVAINTGLGLNSALGGTDGRKALFPDEKDPTQTSNVIAEVGAKYILGRTGDLLPWDEFKKVRPDVTRDEYMQYKAYRWDKGVDLNPFDDGKVIAPLGLAKYNNDGINGAEIQFLGKDMPLDTAIFPTVSAIGGAALGAALGRYGALNEYGIQEAINRRQTIQDEILEKVDGDRNKLSKADSTKVLNLDQDIKKRSRRKELVSQLPGSRYLGKRSPVLTSLAGGAAALIGSSLIGNELERRRREEKTNNQI